MSNSLIPRSFRHREVVGYVITCPVCQITDHMVRFREPGDGPEEPAELIEIDAVGSGPFCECYESDLLGKDYDERMLELALRADRMCQTPTRHRPTIEYTRNREVL